MATTKSFEFLPIDLDQIVTVDFESYYDDEYSLRRQDTSTSEYVRDKRFEAYMCSVKIGRGETKVYRGPELTRVFKRINWKKYDLLAQNTAFDGLVLSHHFGVVPRRYLDTKSLAHGIWGGFAKADLESIATRLELPGKIKGTLEELKGKRLVDIDPELWKRAVEYCANDTELCFAAFEQMHKELPEHEHELIDITLRMFCDPVLRLDRKLARQALEERLAYQQELIIAAGKYIPQTGEDLKKVLTSRTQYAAVLGGALKRFQMPLPMKISKTTQKPTYAFAKDDEDFLALLAHPDEEIKTLVQARLAVSSTQEITRAKRLLTSSSRSQRLPVGLNYCLAHTNRWTGGDKQNFQNFGSGRKGGSDKLRRALKAPPGHVIVTVDSGQIEARVNAFVSFHQELLDDFRNGVDVYCKFATRAYGWEVTKVNLEERQLGKTCVLGLGFGMGGERLQITLAKDGVYIEFYRADELVRLYRVLNEPIVRFWELCQEQIIPDMAMGREGSYGTLKWGKEHIQLPSGMKLFYPGLKVKFRGGGMASKFGVKASTPKVDQAEYWGRGAFTKIYGALLCENIVQAYARDIVAWQMIQISRRYRVVMMSHDEISFICLNKPKEIAAARKFAADIMKTPPAYCADLPLKSEDAVGLCYSK